MAGFRLLEELSQGSSGPQFPKPFDVEFAASVRNDMAAAAGRDAALAAFVNDFVHLPAGHGLVQAMAGNSPYLAQALLKDLDFLRGLAEAGLDVTLAATLGDARSLSAVQDEATIMAGLRKAKRRIAVLVAVADIAGVWPLARITGALSDFADAAVAITVDHLLAAAARRGDLPEPLLETHGLVVLALGKLGAHELNYSSDVDLILLWDQDKVGDAVAAPETVFAGLARRLVHMLQERTAEGYVFRTDLRLRPDGDAGPVAVSMLAAETYYESVGQNWERAALIKARPIAGDLAAGRGFLDRIAPFIWRRHLDYSAIEDIHSIKRQIHTHKGHGHVRVGGHNVKLGAGGIREIEFFAQTQQLIAGGREPGLRTPGTCASIDALAASGRVNAGVARELTEAYDFLRTLEHRLQMIGDEQTHTIPSDGQGLARIATFMGYGAAGAFEAAVLAHLNRVAGQYAKLFEQAPPLTRAGNLVFTGTGDDPDTLKTLASLGFKDPGVVVARVKGWHHGRYRATHSARARALLTDLGPALLEALGNTTLADAALLKFDEFLANLPAGVQVFSLLLAHPELLELVAEVMGSAPALAAALARNPGLFDAMVAADFALPPPLREDLSADLDRALGDSRSQRDFQDVLYASRRWANDRKFHVGVQIMRGLADAPAAGWMLSDLADSLMAALLPRVAETFAAKHGTIPGARFAVMAMGKLGAREMTAESDLDLVFLFDSPGDGGASDGPAPLAETAYFARLAQRFINALGARTAEGRLYEVDMRLRPSGTAGPIASSAESWACYQQEQAWTWEHMALTRARVVAGADDLAAEIDDRVAAILRMPRDPARLVVDVHAMRRRVEAAHGSANPWRVKYVRGGLIDVEFISQYLQLRHAAEAPGVLARGTIEALGNLETAGVLARADAKLLRRATLLHRNVQSLLRQCFQNELDEETAPPGLKKALARACGAPSFAVLKADLLETEAAVYNMFRAQIEEPAKAAAKFD